MHFSKISFDFLNRLVGARLRKKETNIQASITLVGINERLKQILMC
jgi:hypothetical protein